MLGHTRRRSSTRILCCVIAIQDERRRLASVRDMRTRFFRELLAAMLALICGFFLPQS